MGDSEKLRGMVQREVSGAEGALNHLEISLASLRTALRRASADLAAGRSTGSIGLGCATDLDSAAFQVARKVERATVLLQCAYDLEVGA